MAGDARERGKDAGGLHAFPPAPGMHGDQHELPGRRRVHPGQLPRHAETSLIEMRHFRLDEGRDDGVECRGDRSRGFLRHGGQRARRRRAAEHVSHCGARPVSRQELAVPQIDAQRGGPRPVLHRRGHPVRGPALGECPAAAAFPLDQPVLGDLGPHRRDLGYRPPFHTPLRRPGQVRAAPAAAGRLVPDNVIGMITQPHRRARLPLRAAGLASGLLPQRFRGRLRQPVRGRGS